MKKVGFGIVGLGAIAGLHVKAIAALDEAELVAGYDSAPGKADEFCEANGGRAYHDLGAFLDDPRMEAVIIATPSGLHLESAVAACKRGKHVIVEKPLEVTVERCRAIVDAAEGSGVKVLVVYPSRTTEVARLVHDAVAAGRLGKIACADAYVNWYRSQEYYSSGSWRGTWRLDGGGALMNQSIHAVDLLLWFLGDVEEVFARAKTLSHTGIEVEDVAVASLAFKNGALGTIQGTTSAFPGYPKRIEIYGSEGSIVMEEDRLLAWAFKDELPEDGRVREAYCALGAAGSGASNALGISHLGHQALIASFVDSIRRDTPVLIDGREGMRSVRLIETIYRSAREGRPLPL